MTGYLLRRLLLMIPTLLLVLLVNFAIVQAAPGGPVEQAIAELHGFDGHEASTMDGYQTQHGIPPAMIAALEKQYGFDQPWHIRFGRMVLSYLRFDFGRSFYKESDVASLIASKLPVSISLGLWSTLLVYLLAIPLGISKAQRHGSRSDLISSVLITLAFAIPTFLLAVFLVVLLCGGSFWQWFPLRGLTSHHFHQLSLWQQWLDYLWHITLPVLCLVTGTLATTTLLSKNAFLDNLHRPYVLTAAAKGATANRVLYRHVFVNAMMVIASSLPSALVGLLFTGALLIEIIFSLDGLGLLSYEAALSRDYPVLFATLYLLTLLTLVIRLLCDLFYAWLDPRINLAGRGEQ